MTNPTVVKDERIPAALTKNSIMVDFFRQYLSVLDEISEYNSAVLAEKTADWTPGKVLEKAREIARPTEKGVEPDPDVLAALTSFENAVNALALAKRNALEVTAKTLGITLTVTATRDPELEGPLKSRRVIAAEIGKNLNTMAAMITDEKVREAVLNFLDQNPLPQVGRDQARNFGADEKPTPKYRVTVQVVDKDENVLVNEPGFTKGSLAVAKFYPRGEGIKSDKLREAWEAAGNTPEKTVVNPVEFDDNNLHFVLTKKQ